MQLAIQIAGGAAWPAVLAGLLLLACRSGKLAGGILVDSMIAIVVWSFGGDAITAWLDSFISAPLPAAHGTVGPSNAASVLLAMGHMQTISQACEAMLMLWFGLAFLMAVLSVKSPKALPNNSQVNSLRR